MEHKIESLLQSLGIIHPDNVSVYASDTRDIEGLKVYKCKQSGVIYIKGVNHIDQSYYSDKKGTEYWGALDREKALRATQTDDYRRAAAVKERLGTNHSLLDIGTGLGGFMDAIAPYAESVAGVEPQREIRNYLGDLGLTVYSSIDEVTAGKYDFITLFHTFEHLINPLEDLKKIYELLPPNGQLIIEVPHANDFLLSTMELEAFKKFTLWSEHLILHTRNSLKIFLEAAGFRKFTIQGIQRYPLSNHLHWLRHAKPGGHKTWSFLNNAPLDQAYSQTLSSIDANDTLFAIVQK